LLVILYLLKKRRQKYPEFYSEQIQINFIKVHF
jgi:hypothetical protein